MVKPMDDHQHERAKGLHNMTEAEFEAYMREQAPGMQGAGSPTPEQIRGMQNDIPWPDDPPEPRPRKPRLSWWNKLFGG